MVSSVVSKAVSVGVSLAEIAAARCFSTFPAAAPLPPLPSDSVNRATVTASPSPKSSALDRNFARAGENWLNLPRHMQLINDRGGVNIFLDSLGENVTSFTP